MHSAIPSLTDSSSSSRVRIICRGGLASMQVPREAILSTSLRSLFTGSWWWRRRNVLTEGLGEEILRVIVSISSEATRRVALYSWFASARIGQSDMVGVLGL